MPVLCWRCGNPIAAAHPKVNLHFADGVVIHLHVDLPDGTVVCK